MVGNGNRIGKSILQRAVGQSIIIMGLSDSFQPKPCQNG